MLQSLLCLPFLLTMARAQKVSLVPGKGLSRPYAIRVFWGGVTTLLLFFCLQKLPASLATALGYTAPLFTALLAPWLLNERSTAPIQILTAVGFLGVGLNAAPYLGGVSFVFLAVGLLSGFANAMMQISIRKLAARGEPGLRGVFWMHATTAVFAFAACVVQGSWNITIGEVLSCLCIAALSCLAQLTNAAAYKRGAALPVNALSFLTLPMTVALAVVLLHEHIGLPVIAGMALTLPASFALVWLEQRRLKKAHVHADSSLTMAELQEEHAQIQNALSAGPVPLVYTEPTEEELRREDLARCMLVRYCESDD
jgi:drug/metabolite transporter (DMT)-like permease